MDSTENTIQFDDVFESKIRSLVEIDSKLPEINKTFSYGTSGFRYHDSELERLSFRFAVLTSLKSQLVNGLPMGIIITASHNKYQDNGIKICSEDKILSKQWELFYTRLVNSKNFAADLKELITEFYKTGVASEKYFFRDNQARVIIAYDTRRSSIPISNIMITAFKILGTITHSYGYLTSPMLTLLTYYNQKNFKDYMAKYNKAPDSFLNVTDYWSFLNNSYDAFHSLCENYGFLKKKLERYEESFTLDCANGVSSIFVEDIKKIFKRGESIELLNYDYKTIEKLNEDSGAEHVQKQKKIPNNYPTENFRSKNITFDGDADRIIYYYMKSKDDMKVIEGDRLTTLYTLFIKHIFDNFSKTLQENFIQTIGLGIVCTAYSNGSFMKFIREKTSFPLIVAKTGVKYVFEKARQYDISVVFESNGHGGVVFKDTLPSKISILYCFASSSKDSQYLELLNLFLSMFNQTNGDAIGDFVAAECVLKALDMSIEDLYKTYDDLESIQVTMHVKDKNMYIPNDDETRLVEPIALQNKIDEVCLKFDGARCFMRPSGTEDIIRIYAEAKSLEDTKAIIKLVQDVILTEFN